MANYWQDRMTNVQANITDKGIAAIQKQIKKYYQKVMQRTINDFESLYDKVLSQAEEGKTITVADLYKLDKYYQMQAQLKDRLQVLGDNSCALLSSQFEKEYKHVYQALAIDANGQAVKAAISDAAWSTIDEQAAKYAAEQIWCADGKSWSQRVWGNVNDLQQALNDNLIDCVVRGKKTTYLRDVLRERFNVSYHRANTLIRTEMAHIETQAARDRYMADGLEYYQFLADPDERTCDVCASLNKKKFALKDMKPGVNAPPMHPNDRCCIIPVIDNKKETIIIDNRNNHSQNFSIGRSLGAKAHNYKILDHATGEIFSFAEGTIIQDVQVFAGKGASTPLREEVKYGLAEQLGGKPDDWQHAKGVGIVDFYGEERKAEVHWFQAKEIGRVKFKIKRWLK